MHVLAALAFLIGHRALSAPAGHPSPARKIGDGGDSTREGWGVRGEARVRYRLKGTIQPGGMAACRSNVPRHATPRHSPPRASDESTCLPGPGRVGGAAPLRAYRCPLIPAWARASVEGPLGSKRGSELVCRLRVKLTNNCTKSKVEKNKREIERIAGMKKSYILLAVFVPVGPACSLSYGSVLVIWWSQVQIPAPAGAAECFAACPRRCRVPRPASSSSPGCS